MKTSPSTSLSPSRCLRTSGHSYTGFIHEVLKREYLDGHPDPKQVDYYLCGPPAMIQAATKMLAELGVDPSQIAYDAF